MLRAPVVVREAGPGDVEVLARSWAELREVLGRADRLAPAATAAGVAHRLREAAANPDCRILVAVVGDDVVGSCVLVREAYAPLFEVDAVHLSYLHVADGARRRGVGKALIAAAAAFAEEVGAEHVVTTVPPQLREANRFYARLGFGPVVIRRAVALPVLRRRLALECRGPAVEEVLARRRSVRRMQTALARVTAGRSTSPG